MSDDITITRLDQKLRRFGPKSADHPSVGDTCIGCDQPFREGEYTTLIALGPADEEQAAKMEAGRPYNAEAKEVHWRCAYRLPEHHPEAALDG